MINDWLAIAQEEGGKKEGGKRETKRERERGENSASASDWSCR